MFTNRSISRVVSGLFNVVVILSLLISAVAFPKTAHASNVWTILDLDTLGGSLVAAGDHHSCLLTTSGGVKCWGGNYAGQLGNGSTSYTNTIPVDVSGLTNGVSAITARYQHTCALTTSGGVKCWGKNAYGELGDGTTTQRNIPVDVNGLTSGVTAIAAGAPYTCALMTSGGVKCWGYNQFGQLGDGTTIQRNTPVDVSGLTSGVSAITANAQHTCALTTSGGVKCWGYNQFGQLGDGTTIQRNTPVDVMGLTNGVSAIAAGAYDTCAVTTSGGIKCWGYNGYGELGDGTTIQRNTPVDVIGLTSTVIAIAGGQGYTCALTTDGGVKCWGRNEYSQLGDGTTNNSSTPVDVSTLTSGVNSIAAGNWHGCASLTSGVVKCWGLNGFGQLGDGTTINRMIPVDVSGLEPTPTAVDQTITVTTHAPTSAIIGSSFTVAATASSLLPVTYSSSGACTNVGADFTMTSGAGACTVMYNQAGDANYNPAPQVTESVTPLPIPTMRFVASTGVDTGNCASITTSCRTINYAISQAVAGNTIEIAAGTYTEAGITVDKDLTLTGAAGGTASTIVQAATSPSTATNRVFSINSGVTATLQNLTIQHGNPTGNGGGILNSGFLTLNNIVVFANSLSAAGSNGGGLYNSGRLTLNNSTVRSNSVTWANGSGGGIYNDTTTGEVTLNNSTVSFNSANSAGGGIFNTAGILTLNNSTVNGNTVSSASGFGGGISNNNGTSTLNNSTVSGNSGRDGGGLYTSGGGSLRLSYSTVSNNSAGSSGGGIANGGGTGSINLWSNIVAGNQKGTNLVDPAADCSGTMTSQGYNLTGINTGCALSGTGDVTVAPTNVFTDVLGVLANNGGVTQTHALRVSTSNPALNAIAINTNSCGAAPLFNLDQRGQARPFNAAVNGRCDIGAYEAQSAPVSNYTLTVVKAGTGSGTVTSSPAGIACGSDCSETYANNTFVTLTAAASVDSSFTGWTGGGCSGTGTCTVTLTSDMSITATFTLNTLTVVKAGTGSGTITSSPVGINCGVDCSEPYPNNTVVTLTAAPVIGSTFTGWSGAGCTGTGTCMVTVAGPRTVTATFTLTPMTNQTITVSTNAPASAINGSSFTVAATASSGLPVSYSSSGACTNVSATFTMTSGTGTCTVMYDQAGNASYNPAPQVIEAVAAVPPPSLSISDVNLTEGNTGTTDAVFTVSLSVPSSQIVTVDFLSADGTATAGSDYVATSGTLTFDPGDTSKAISVPINGDFVDEPDQTFTISLSNASNANIATAVSTGTILDDDAAPDLSIDNVNVTEGNTGTSNAVFTVSLSAASSSTVTVDFTSNDGTATAGSDYVATSGILTFNPGETTQTISVDVIGDVLVASNQTFFVNLTNPVNAVIANGQAIGTILDDDTPMVSGPSYPPPGGVSFARSGDIGRYGGIDFTYTNFDFSQFSALFWGPAQANAVGIAFDSNIDAPSEFLTYTPSQSDLPNGIEVWSGSANITIVNSGTVTLPTRFTLQTFDLAGNPISLVDGAGQGIPDTGAVVPVTSSFKAHMIMEAYYGGSWIPVKNLFDSLQTQDGVQVKTSFQGGFFYLTPFITVTVTDESVAEPTSGTTNAVFTVSLSSLSDQPVSVNFATANDTANAGSDYEANSGTLTFGANETTKTVNVQINSDMLNEPDETFFLNLNNPINVTIVDGQGVGTILNNSQTITVTTNAPASARAGDVFTVQATASSGLPVAYSASGSCINVNGTITMTSGTGTCTVMYDQAGDSTYNPAPQVTEVVNAEKAVLTVTADDQSVNYGDPDPGFTFAYSGFVGSDGPSNIDTPPTCNVSVAHVNVGNYAITCSGASDNDYTFNYVDGTLSISQRPVTVTGVADTKVYDGNTSSAGVPTISLGTLASGDTANFTQVFDTKDIGTGKLLIPSGYVNDGNSGNNYAVTFVDNTTGVITSSTLTVTGITAYNKVYDGNTIAALNTSSASLVGVVPGDNVQLDTVAATGDFDNKNVGNGKTVTISGLTLTGVDAGNYIFIQPITTANITVRPITVTADSQSKVYGSVDPALTYQAQSGALLSGDSFSGVLTRISGENIGAYAISQGTLTAGSNYNISFVSNDLTITSKPITITADPQIKVYGSADPALTYQLTSGALESGDSFTGALTRVSGEDVGTYSISQGTLSAGSNYDLIYVGTDLTITAKPITVTADPQTKIYGSGDPALTYQLTSGALESGDSFTGALTRVSGEDVGTYLILQGTLSAGSNYDLIYVSNDLTITAKPITVTADPQTKIYGSGDPALTYQLTSGALESGDSFTGALMRVSGEDAGTYSILQGTLSAGSNYSLTFVSNDLTITKADQSIINVTAPISAVNGQVFTVSADATSNLPITYSASGACTNVGTDFTMTSGEGACTVIIDQAGDTNFNPAPQVTQVVADATPPTVISSLLADTSPTNAASVNFTVIFSESVTGVDASDFSLTTTGVSGAAVSGVSGSGAVYIIEVNTGSGDGTIRLNAADNDSIIDGASNPLGGTGAGNGNYTAGQIYTIDKTAPTVLSILRANPNPTASVNVNYTVTFSENVTGVDAVDFSLTLTGVTGASITSISGNNTIYNVTVNTGTGTGTIRFRLIDDDTIADGASNKLGGIGIGNGNFTGQPYSIRKTLSYTSGAAQDGWVLESGENTNVGGTGSSNGNVSATTFNLGDNAQDRQYRGIVHFDTTSLPDNAVITSVTLRIKRSSLVGTNPFSTHQGLMVDITKPYFGTSVGLQPIDFNAAANQNDVGTFGTTPSSNWYTATLGSNAYSYINLTGTTQFRLRFQLDDNDDLGADYMLFFSGNSTTANRPVLVIEYYVP